jgi:hypothetical protein
LQEVNMSRALKFEGVVFLCLAVFPFSLPSQAQTKPMELSAAEVKSLLGEWHGSDRDLDHNAIRQLAQVRRDAEVTVFFSTSYPNGKREVPRLLKILSDLRQPRFSVKFYLVDKDQRVPAKLLEMNDIVFFPTFLVTRQGKEVGRIVERPPRAIETDLTMLLSGKTDGLMSGSESVIWHYLRSADESPENPD